LFETTQELICEKWRNDFTAWVRSWGVVLGTEGGVRKEGEGGGGVRDRGGKGRGRQGERGRGGGGEGERGEGEDMMKDDNG